MTGIIFYELGPCLLHCTVKVQIFRKSRRADKEDSHSLVVQFHRKKDDVVAFNHIFKKVSAQLQEHANRMPTSISAPNNVKLNLNRSDLPSKHNFPMLPDSTNLGSD